MRSGSKKIYYSISEVSEITGIKPHILRFWEKDFPMLRPRKNRGGNRTYREREIRVVLAIKRLLYDEGYTIKGASNKIRQDRSTIDEVQIESVISGGKDPEGSPRTLQDPSTDALGDVLKNLRKELNEGQTYPEETNSSFFERLSMRLWRRTVISPRMFKLAGRVAGVLQWPLARRGRIRWLPFPLSRWTRYRTFPAVASRPFRSRWRDLE